MSTEPHDQLSEIIAHFDNFARTNGGHEVLFEAVKTIKDMEAFTGKIRPFFLRYLQNRENDTYNGYTTDEYIEAKGGSGFTFNVEFPIRGVFLDYTAASIASREAKVDSRPSTENKPKSPIVKWAVIAAVVIVAAYCTMNCIF